MRSVCVPPIGLQSGFNCTSKLKSGIIEELKLLCLEDVDAPSRRVNNLYRRLVTMDTLPFHGQDDNTPLKRCPKCPEGQQWHPATSEFFHRQKDKKDGYSSHCKACKNKSQREKYQQPEVRLQKSNYSKARYQQPEVREQQLKQQKAHRSLPEVRQQRKEYDVLYMSRPEVRARRQRYLKEYIELPGKREKARAKVRRYRRSPKGQVYQKAYINRPEVRKRMRFYEKTYRNTPKGRLNSITKQQNREARKKSIPGSYTPAQIQEQLKRQHYRCYYAACGHSKFQRIRGNGKWRHIGYEIEHTYPVSRVVGTDIPANDMSYIVLSCPSCNRRKQDKFPWEWAEGGRLL